MIEIPDNSKFGKQVSIQLLNIHYLSWLVFKKKYFFQETAFPKK